MPPKSKFTEQEILCAAVEEAERIGFDNLTARTLAAALGSSPRPIFTVFNSMDDVKDGVIAVARDIYKMYVDEGLAESPAFKGVGKAYIRFAVSRPKLFALLFMREQERTPSVNDVLDVIDGSAERIIRSVIDEYGLSAEKAKRVYLHMWLYTHGIAVSLATKLCTFTQEQISAMLTEVMKPILQSVLNEEGK